MLDELIGHKLIELDEVDSTNSYASRLLFDEQVIEGTAIMAQFQNAGKGQRTAVWESEKGKNLTVSYILYPRFLTPENHFELNQILSLAVKECLQTLTESEIKIKWPNDIMADDKKIAGILAENNIGGNQIKTTIAGFGININQTVFNRYDPAATSLKLIENKNFDPKLCFRELNKFMNKWYALLQSKQTGKINSAYKACLFRLNEPHTYETMGLKFSGIIRGVDAGGKLIISHTDDREIHFANKEVRFIF